MFKILTCTAVGIYFGGVIGGFIGGFTGFVVGYIGSENSYGNAAPSEQYDYPEDRIYRDIDPPDSGEYIDGE